MFKALNNGGVFCFNVVDRLKIDNRSFVKHATQHQGETFSFRSGWHYAGEGEKQLLKLNIEKTDGQKTQVWHDEHPMVAFTIEEISAMLKPWFEVHIFEHDYDKISPWDQRSGNAIIVCVKA